MKQELLPLKQLDKEPLIVVKNSKIHSKGMYAKTDIKKGTKIIEYTGEVISKEEGDIRAEEQYKLSKKNKENGAVYVFELNKKFDIDGNVEHNIARFLNHSCNPNCKYKIENNHIWIISIKDIKKSEEITYDYGYDLVDYKDHPCKCNSENCIGFIIGKKYRNQFKRTVLKNKITPPKLL